MSPLDSLVYPKVYPRIWNVPAEEDWRGLRRFFRFRPRPPEFKANRSRLALSFLGFPRATRGSGRFCVGHSRRRGGRR
jgi:hypothetical protein